MRRTAVLAAVALAFAAAASAAPLYHLVDLGMLPGGTSSVPRHFGPGPTVLGGTDLPGTFGGHATRWDLTAQGGVVSVTDLLGLTGFDGSFSSGMNAGGWIVGWSNTADPQPRPILWRAGDILDLDRGGDGNANVYAFDVNDAGTICGMITKSGGGGGWNAAIWVERAGQPGRFDRSFLPMHPSGDPVFGWTEAQAIDASGRVFGRTNLGIGDRASLWLADAGHTPVLLEPLANSNQSMPGDWNDAGDAVGYTMYPFGLDRATRWSRDTLHTPTELPMWPGYNESRAQVVSADGATVLGSSSLIDVTVFPWVALQTRIVLWRDGAIFDLGACLDASGAGWTLTDVADMNADGWILATATQGGISRAVVLLPQASTLAVGSAPATRALAAPTPNPAFGRVQLAFALPHDGDASLTLYDTQGRTVARLAHGFHAAGAYSLEWNGRTEQGTAASPGVYFARLEAGPLSETRRLVWSE